MEDCVAELGEGRSGKFGFWRAGRYLYRALTVNVSATGGITVNFFGAAGCLCYGLIVGKFSVKNQPWEGQE